MVPMQLTADLVRLLSLATETAHLLSGDSHWLVASFLVVAAPPQPVAASPPASDSVALLSPAIDSTSLANGRFDW